MKHLFKLFMYALVIGFFASSCSDDDDAMAPQEPRGDYENGLLISHEGAFNGGFGTVSFVSDDLSSVENEIFSGVNARNLGTIAQSIAFNGDFAYIIINVSNQIEVVNRYTFESVATIDSGLSNPRFMAVANGRGYVTNWGDGTVPTDDYIAIIDLNTNSITSETIAVDEGPESIIARGNNLYVANEGGFSQNNIVTVINVDSNTVTSTIEVGDVPNSLELDSNGNLWVLSGGKPSFTGDETAGSLSRIDLSSNAVTSFDFGTTDHPNYLTLDNGSLYYYLNGSVYQMQTSDSQLPNNPELTGLNFYEMRVRNSVLYGLDAKDFNSDGDLVVYDLNNNTEIQSITLGLIPGEVYFN